MQQFKFTPEDGLRDASVFPSRPADEAAARGQFQTLYDQLRDYINTLVSSLASAQDGGGASLIGSGAISGVSGSTVREQLVGLKELINRLVTGGDGLVSDGMLEDDIKIGSLAQLLCSQRDSVVSAINGVLSSVRLYSKLFLSGGVFDVPFTGIYKVTVIGGGGGGEGLYSSASSLISGGAGGGGGCAVKWIPLCAGDNINITVGAGGPGGTGASSSRDYVPGGAGGASSFGIHCSATGGNGGSTYSGTELELTGLGGSGIGGLINIKGGQGGTLANPTQTSIYANPYYRAGVALHGGDSFLGRGAITPYVSAGSDGVSATEIGGGGSPPLVKGYASRPGGNGAGGCVLIEYAGYIPPQEG